LNINYIIITSTEVLIAESIVSNNTFNFLSYFSSIANYIIKVIEDRVFGSNDHRRYRSLPFGGYKGVQNRVEILISTCH
jgi:hypothetical protein